MKLTRGIILSLIMLSISFNSSLAQKMSPRQIVEAWKRTPSMRYWDVEANMFFSLGDIYRSLNNRQRQQLKNVSAAMMLDQEFMSAKQNEIKTFRIIDESIIRDSANVTVFVQLAKSSAQVVYRLHKVNGTWKIYGTKIQGLSEEEARSKIANWYRDLEKQQGGFDNMIKFLQKRFQKTVPER